MVDRIRLANGEGMLGKPNPIKSADGKLTETAAAYLSGVLQGIVDKLNGKISFGNGEQSTQSGNIDGQWITFVTPAVADTQFEVPHGLGRLPVGRDIKRQDKAGTLYDSNPGGWGPKSVFFKCSVASVKFNIVLQ